MEKDDWANLGYADVRDPDNPDTDRDRGVPYVSKSAAAPTAAPIPAATPPQSDQRQV